MSDVTVTKDVANKSLTLVKVFDAPRQKVWQAWTDGSILEKWWGPDGWPATTKSFDFREGGIWHYKMTGPDGTEGWSLVTYKTIDEPNSITAEDAFSDADGNVNDTLPRSTWHVTFEDLGGQTQVTTKLTFATAEDVQRLIDMGFEAGYKNSLSNLETYLQNN